jgi:hypothetical protein
MSDTGVLHADDGGPAFAGYDPLEPRSPDRAMRRILIISLGIHLLLLLLFWDSILGVVMEKEETVTVMMEEEPEKPKPQPKLIQQTQIHTAVQRQKDIQHEIQKIDPVQRHDQVKQVQVADITRVEAPKIVQQSDLTVARTDVFADRVAKVQPIQVNTKAPRVKSVSPVVTESSGPRKQIAAAPTINPKAVAVNAPNVTDGVLSAQSVAGAEEGARVGSVSGTTVSDRLATDGKASIGSTSKDCMTDPKCRKYLEMIRDRVYARWSVPSDVSAGKVVLSFRIDRGGTAHTIRQKRADDPNLGSTCVQAFRNASPFPAPPPEIQYLVSKGIAATFHYGN